MKNYSCINNDVFTVESIGDVVILGMKGNPLYPLIDLQAKETLFDCIDEINNREDIRVLVIIGPAIKPEYEEYVDLFRLNKGPDTDRRSLQAKGISMYLVDYDTLARFCNAVNQFVLKIVGFNKFVIHADSGPIISPFMNLSLACDYRIVGKHSVYKNPYLGIGLVPKGGSAYFLARLIGYRNAKKVLLADDTICADEALKLGIVDQVVSTCDLYETALKTARRYAELPARSLSGIKKLLNCSPGELETCLKCEDEQFLQIANSEKFRNKLKTYTTDSLQHPMQ